MSQDEMRQHLINAIKSRALFYWAFYQEFSAEIGPEKTAEIMKRAIYKRGIEIGKAFGKFAPGDMAGLKDAFVDNVPDPEATFNPLVERCDAAGIDIQLQSCPLRDAWKEAGLTDAEIELMTHIAGRVDNGTFEGAGFEFSADTWKSGASGCCHLHIRPGQKGK
jgi:hypothetical protein